MKSGQNHCSVSDEYISKFLKIYLFALK